MASCTVCSQREARLDGLYCAYACYAVTAAGVAEVDAKHILKEAQVTARTTLLATSVAAHGTPVTGATAELNAYAADDDGVDR